MIKRLKKIIGLNAKNAKTLKATTYVDNRTFVYANDSVITNPNIGTADSRKSSNIDKDYLTNTTEKKANMKANDFEISDKKNSCHTDCPCWEKAVTKNKICPLCGHKFGGKGWEGIDAHYRAKHEKHTGIPYSDWWAKMCADHKN